MTKQRENELFTMLQRINENQENLKKEMADLNARITTLEKGKPSPKKPSRTSKKTQPKTDFDRALYEKLAKKHGCFYKGKVCATVKDGKVIRTREQNRAIIYAEMGL